MFACTIVHIMLQEFKCISCECGNFCKQACLRAARGQGGNTKDESMHCDGVAYREAIEAIREAMCILHVAGCSLRR